MGIPEGVLHTGEQRRGMSQYSKRALDFAAESSTPIDVEVSYSPGPKQWQFHDSQAKYRLFSGAVRAGKTLAGVHEGIQLSLAYPGNVGLIGRNTYPELMDSTVKEFFKAIRTYEESMGVSLGDPSWGESEGIVGYNASHEKKSYKFSNGSLVWFRYFKRSGGEPKHIKGIELGWWYMDEGVDVAHGVFLELMARLSMKDVPLRGFITTNPGPRNHWLYKTFMKEKASKTDYDVIFTNIYDNAQNLPDDLIPSLEEGYDEDWRARYLRGEWKNFAGLVYGKFTRGKHTLDLSRFHVKGGRDMKVYVGVDFGYPSPSVLEPVLTDGISMYVAPEFYEAETSSDDLIRHALNMNKIYQGRCLFVADPSGADIIKRMEDAGLDVVKASYRSVSDGIGILRNLFEKGLIKVHEDNSRLISDLESYRYKTRDGEVVGEMPEKRDDHGPDALRYAVTEILAGDDSFSVDWEDFDAI